MSPRLREESSFLMCAPPPYRQRRAVNAMLNALIIQISSIFEPEPEGLFHIWPVVDRQAGHDNRVRVLLLLLSLGMLIFFWLLHSCSPFFTPIVAGVRLLSPAFASISRLYPRGYIHAIENTGS